MAGPGEASQANVHAAWRMALAGQAAEAYAGNAKLAALAVAGSVGSGLADRFSDLELDCYWRVSCLVHECGVAPDPALPGWVTRTGSVRVAQGDDADRVCRW